MVKLYEVPRDTRIKVGDIELNFRSIDGMYSYCTTDNGEVVHLAAWTEVEILDKDMDEI
jgi:hypothetical protein